MESIFKVVFTNYYCFATFKEVIKEYESSLNVLPWDTLQMTNLEVGS